MQLIGMLDSPYVRRVHISLTLLGIAFEHRSISVFRTFDEFSRINPVVKAPSFVCDDGEVLMDSTLIIEYAQALAAPRKSLMPAGLRERQHALRVVGLALAACEKSVQLVYERTLRPPEKQHEPWAERVTAQMRTAYALLEEELQRRPLACTTESIDQAGVTAAVAWQFTNMLLPSALDVSAHPALRAHSESAEALPAFLAAPPQ